MAGRKFDEIKKDVNIEESRFHTAPHRLQTLRAYRGDYLCFPSTELAEWAYKLVEKFFERYEPFFRRHEEVGQSYATYYPYAVHLCMVMEEVDAFIPPQAEKWWRDVCMYAAAGHDLLEDTRMTYNDLGKFLSKLQDPEMTPGRGQRIADIIYALTDEKGKNREQRHSEAYWRTLWETPGACFVKMADRMANIRWSKMNFDTDPQAKRMYKIYMKEMPEFLAQIRKAPDYAAYIGIYHALETEYITTEASNLI